MRYELKRNKNGMITQCDNNADGGNIYAQREEINKVALKNLERPTPGKLGNLSNLQVFNFTIGTFATGTADFVFKEYNTGSTFPANTVDTIMFGVDSLNNKGLYYNIKDVRINLLRGDRVELLPDSFVEFYLVQNNELSFETYQFFSISIFSDLANFEAYNKKIFKKAKNVILSILILLICCDLANLRDFI